MTSTFKDFLLESESEEEKNLQALLKKLPAGHRKLLHGYKFKFQGGNTLKGDNEHVGLIHKNKITVAAPWHYSRSFSTVHEIAHLVYEYKMTPKLKKEWKDLVKKTKQEQKKKIKKEAHEALSQNAEELFCMIYAATYTKHPPKTFHHPEWIEFIKHHVPK